MAKSDQFPSWRYKKGAFGRVESQCFQTAEDVPPGWVDDPDDAQRAGSKTRKPKAKAKKG